MNPPTRVVTSRVLQEPFTITTWTLLAVALVTMTIRTVSRFRVYRKFEADDYLLLLASACLLAATIFTQTRVNNIYRNSRLNLNPTPAELPKSMDELNGVIHTEITYIWIFSTFIWTTIYSAKFAYLLFFRRLVLRLKLLMRCWWFVSVVTGLSYVNAIVHAFTVCPWPDLRAAGCSIGARATMVRRFSIAIMTLDVVTDALIVLLAVMILAKVKTRTLQKLTLAFFLCLSAVSATIAIIRVSHPDIRSIFGTRTSDGPWNYFWLQVEGCMGICLVSLTAFRSFFVAKERKQEEERARKAWYSSVAKRLIKNRQSNETEKQGLPSIPSATLTGLGSFFGATRRDRTNRDTESTSVDDETTSDGRTSSQIMVKRTFEVEQHTAQPKVSYRPFDTQNTQSTRTMPPSFRSQSRSTLPPSYHERTLHSTTASHDRSI